MTKQQLIIAILYSLFFPLSAIFYKPLAGFALFVNAPFLPVGWVGGMAFVSIFHTESVYPLGLFITIFLQVFFVIKHFDLFSKSFSIKPIILIFLVIFIIAFLSFPHYNI